MLTFMLFVVCTMVVAFADFVVAVVAVSLVVVAGAVCSDSRRR